MCVHRKLGRALPAILLAGLLLGMFSAAATGTPARRIDPNSTVDLGSKGPFEIGFTTFVLTDPTRAGDGGTFVHRPIPVYLWYPVDPQAIDGTTPKAVYPLDPLYQTSLNSTSDDWEAVGMDPAYREPQPSLAGPFPLVIVSPGWGMPAWMHMSIGTRLASHGFVVAVLYHFGDQWWPWEPPYDHVAVASLNRPRDMSLALTELLARNQVPENLLHGLLRPDQVAAAGHSLGGYASMVLAGGDDSVCDGFQVEPYLSMFGPPPAEACVPAATDPRFKLIMPLDGSSWILHFQELARVHVPSLGMGEEWSMLAQDPDPTFAAWQARQHAAFMGNPNYRVDVLNTVHLSFCDICPAAQVLGALGIWTPADVDWWLANFCTGVTSWADAHRLVTQYMAAFLKRQFGREATVASMLTPGYAITHEPLVEFFVTEKRNPAAIDDDWPGFFVYFMHQPGAAQARAAMDPASGFPTSRLPGGGHVAGLRAADAEPSAGRSGPDAAAGTGRSAFATFPAVLRVRASLSIVVEQRSQVSLRVYDIRGAMVETLASGTFAPGTYSFTVDPARLPAGVYLLGLNQGGVREGRKFVVLR